MINNNIRKGALAAAALVLTLAGCVVTPVADVGLGGPLGGSATTAPAGNGSIPIINLFDANPKSVTSGDQKVTFTVNVSVPNGAPAQYNWASTLGTLSSTTGQVVYWSPAGADGKVKAGSATVTVIITANNQTVTGNANIIIKEDGSATVNIAPAPAASAAPASAAPSAAPSAEASATAPASASPSPEASATATPAATATATPAATTTASPAADPSATPSTAAI